MKNESIVKSTLAKLLAHENISVQHGNFSTAFFDVKNRILGLPNWKDKGKDVNDLLVGHEVGHALYTPSDALDKDYGCSKDYLNIVEDVRIERMIQSTYPGLVGAFRRGYSTLNNDDFFGMKGKNLNSYGIADRINLKAKLGSLLDIQFSQDEMPIVTQVMNVQTWEDTVAAAVALSKFAAEQNKGNKKEKPQNSPNNDKAEKNDESNDDSGLSSPADSSDQSEKSERGQDVKSESTEKDKTLKSDAEKENSAKEDSKDGPENKAEMDGNENNLTSMPSDNKNPPGTPPVRQRSTSPDAWLLPSRPRAAPAAARMRDAAEQLLAADAVGLRGELGCGEDVEREDGQRVRPRVGDPTTRAPGDHDATGDPRGVAEDADGPRDR